MASLSAEVAIQSLSSSERKVLRYLVRGYTRSEAACTLGLPSPEVERLHASICRKLHLRGRPAVYEYAVAIGLLGRNGKAQVWQK